MPMRPDEPADERSTRDDGEEDETCSAHGHRRRLLVPDRTDLFTQHPQIGDRLVELFRYVVSLGFVNRVLIGH